jgi:long-subunit fatty acid transport protein
MAGAAASHVEGAQSLLFNPAGLAAGDRLGLELSGQFSPTFGAFNGPITTPGVRVDGKRTFSPVFAGLVGYRPTERLGLGAGLFVSGGTNADFPNVDLSGFGAGFTNYHPEIKAYLRVLDASLGASYELADGFRVGVAWRISFVHAELDTVAPVTVPGSPAPVAAVGVRLTDLNDTRVNGFRFGFQYAPKKKMWGFGANVRTGVSFVADGNLNTEVFTAGSTAATPLPQTTASAASVFPWQFSLGAFVAPLDRKLLVSVQYDFTNYAADRNIVLNGTIPIPPPPAGTGPRPLPAIQQRWMGQNQVRVGGEYNGVGNWAFRAGYAYTSHVTPSGFARPTFAAPGSGHTFTGGLGYRFMEGRLRTDLGGEYSFDSGDGTNEFGVPGPFRADAWVIHGGVTLFI